MKHTQALNFRQKSPRFMEQWYLYNILTKSCSRSNTIRNPLCSLRVAYVRVFLPFLHPTLLNGCVGWHAATHLLLHLPFLSWHHPDGVCSSLSHRRVGAVLICCRRPLGASGIQPAFVYCRPVPQPPSSK